MTLAAALPTQAEAASTWNVSPRRVTEVGLVHLDDEL
jgi:hypothetical protein